MTLNLEEVESIAKLCLYENDVYIFLKEFREINDFRLNQNKFRTEYVVKLLSEFKEKKVKKYNIRVCWNCGELINKIAGEQRNKYHCGNCQMDCLIDVKVTYQYEKAKFKVN